MQARRGDKKGKQGLLFLNDIVYKKGSPFSPF